MAANHGETTTKPLVIAGILGLLVASLGGYACGFSIDQFGMAGSAALWALGAAAGALAKRCFRPNRMAGALLAAAVIIAFVVAEVWWIRWNIVNVASWSEALMMFPQFVKEFRVPSLIGGIMTAFGAISAYQQAGLRIRYVAVVND